ncbi:hypothetical protein [Halobellus clavatus]|jgi:hypothetical protein|uniref:Uncharacterized protein n=1 Tax=Halobellus clavatus TaxID=660517 RepID=A0A1H3FAT1_9EURY|nr:hypothetical protein [Halobellus clavatus]SDX87249.1 hypothetical protein SAMN04487946_103225 [Halobellus clavatus]
MSRESEETDEEAGEQSLEATVAAVLRDVDAAYDDYERGYVDADATLSVVMTHVERLREAQADED